MNDWVDRRLAGRLPGVHLNAEGRAQAAALAERLGEKRIHRVVSSPLERARETAAPLAEALRVPVELSDAFTEVAFGEWEGRDIPALECDPRWRLYNVNRSGTSAPGGERLIDTQARFVEALEALRADHSAETLAVVSHADPIRAALLHCLGMPIDFYRRLEILPASISVVEIGDCGPRVLGLNLEDGSWL
jgi:probable phosphoglycerate mutase